MYTPPKVTREERFYRWLHRRWNHQSLQAQAVYRAWAFVLLVVAGTLVALQAIGYLILQNVLNLQTFVSFGAVEVLAFLLYRLSISNRERERRIDELIQVALSVPKFSHLVYHFLYTGSRLLYPDAPRFILNTK